MPAVKLEMIAAGFKPKTDSNPRENVSMTVSHTPAISYDKHRRIWKSIDLFFSFPV
jgi:hypothetical protein